MRKLSLILVGLLVGLLQIFSQVTTASTDSMPYKSRKLNFEEANLVSGYYHQEGNNSAVTGGIGNERLNDFSNTLDLKLTKWDSKNRKHTFAAEFGVDVYTSASSDMIDLRANTSASYQDVRVYPSVTWSVENPRNGITWGANTSFSTEYDYTSVGGGLNFSKTFNKGNSELSLKTNAFFDSWEVILPTELRPAGSGPRNRSPQVSSPRNSFSAALSFAQVLSKRFQFALLADPSFQNGLLATRYQRVYFTDGSVASENLPNTRWKLPLGVRGSYFAGDNIVLRGLYRYYTDAWQLSAHMVQLETVFKISPFLSISPFYRYYQQTAAQYFSAYKTAESSQIFATSDHDLSAFDSHYFGASVKWSPLQGVLGWTHFHTLELRYGHYARQNAVLAADMISLNLKFK
jgi:hypothetical protein